MVNECTLIFETEPPIPFTVADGTGIEKGAILKLSDPMTAALATGDADIIAGIAAEEKIANDGKTKLAVYRRGIFRGFAATGGVTVGLAINVDASTSDSNEIVVAAAGHDKQLGTSFETATSGESFLFELNPTHRDEA
jgi:hypothetical protein